MQAGSPISALRRLESRPAAPKPPYGNLPWIANARRRAGENGRVWAETRTVWLGNRSVCREIVAGSLDPTEPLVVWRTSSLTALAERGGFEPPIPLRVCRISSAVLSTAQPPLLGARGERRRGDSDRVPAAQGRQAPRVTVQLALSISAWPARVVTTASRSSGLAWFGVRMAVSSITAAPRSAVSIPPTA